MTGTGNPVIKVWMLSQLYECPIHPCDGNPDGTGWEVPVCGAYGRDHFFHRMNGSGWCLAHIVTTPQQLEAAKKDPRVVVCGKHHAKPPAKLLEVYAAWLDPNEAYRCVGEVLEKLAETEPMFHQE